MHVYGRKEKGKRKNDNDLIMYNVKNKYSATYLKRTRGNMLV